MLARFFVDRPVFATVLSLAIVLLGIISLARLPIAQYPEVTPPTIQITAVYPGANAQVVADTVAAPLEQEIRRQRVVTKKKSPSILLAVSFVAKWIDRRVGDHRIRTRRTGKRLGELDFAATFRDIQSRF